jgi:hypothetical protein
LSNATHRKSVTKNDENFSRPLAGSAIQKRAFLPFFLLVVSIVRLLSSFTGFADSNPPGEAFSSWLLELHRNGNYYFFFLSCANMKMRRGAFAEASAAGWPRRLLFFFPCSFSVSGSFLLVCCCCLLVQNARYDTKGKQYTYFRDWGESACGCVNSFFGLFLEGVKCDFVGVDDVVMCGDFCQQCIVVRGADLSFERGFRQVSPHRWLEVSTPHSMAARSA